MDTFDHTPNRLRVSEKPETISILIKFCFCFKIQVNLAILADGLQVISTTIRGYESFVLTHLLVFKMVGNKHAQSIRSINKRVHTDFQSLGCILKKDNNFFYFGSSARERTQAYHTTLYNYEELIKKYLPIQKFIYVS